ncbi:MAG: hypothetical protein KJ773_06335, partial [Candidatus Thermoplasmatota archaeon]|nr:hypothetical protein [Candidatus Thermoplasmatota archaeon]
MVKTEIEKEIHKLIMNDLGIVNTTKRTWDNGNLVDVSITYSLFGVILMESGVHQILVEVKSFKPAVPHLSNRELQIFLKDDLKRRFDLLRNTNITVLARCWTANKQAILDILRGDFLNMCYDLDMGISDIMQLL